MDKMVGWLGVGVAVGVRVDVEVGVLGAFTWYRSAPPDKAASELGAVVARGDAFAGAATDSSCPIRNIAGRSTVNRVRSRKFPGDIL